MKKLLGVIMIALAILAGSQFASAGGHPRSYHQSCHHSRHHHRSGGNTFGAICAGIVGLGLITAAVSSWNRPAYVYVYPPPPPPPPVYHPRHHR